MQFCRLFGLIVLATNSYARFEIFYDDQDASVIAGSLLRSDLSQTEKQMATKIWNGGMKNWASQPAALSPCDDPTLPYDAHGIIIDVQGVTKQDMVNLLNSIALHTGFPQPGGYLQTLALDLQQCAVEPV